MPEQNNQPSNQPLTRKEMQESSAERIALISKEFADGFNFIKDYPRSVTFFGGTRFKPGDFYYEKALSLGARVAKDLGYSVYDLGNSSYDANDDYPDFAAAVAEKVKRRASMAGTAILKKAKFQFWVILPPEQRIGKFAVSP